MKRAAPLLALASLACAATPRWGSADTALQATYAASLTCDYLQTRQGVRAGSEINPIIGKHGEHVPPAIYFPAAFTIHTALMIFVPRPYRNIVQGVSIGASAATVYSNWRAGWEVQF